ncbi:KH domain RNA-binding protein Rnc1 [Schizosaccharomyces osmophilus]|uniref:KH domain RNA-binding protein Rnc1 n=1 Tax=Schizosaccharomyces osmophilus TaxID=2545709 RepID=A0AAE9WBZ1_9SCHI|nr:KH domain RNA-binding protein Rnc1 [Schizosaccharomyces osmophilus]WBW73496.1 KH domain RNA-binding protein Rnc1 [Schizosaccharomyces osmophilus]
MCPIQLTNTVPISSMAYNHFAIPKSIEEKENSFFDVTFQDEPEDASAPAVAASLSKVPPTFASASSLATSSTSTPLSTIQNGVTPGLQQAAQSMQQSQPLSTSQQELPITATPPSTSSNKPTMDDTSYANQQLTLRALLSTREAGIVIGKAGKNVAELRTSTNVKAGVTKAVPNVHDRVLTVSGSLENVVRAYRFIIDIFARNSTNADGTPVEPAAPRKLRLLIAHSLMGSIIGKNGLRIKHIQDKCSCRMIASKDMLPQSTERTVEVHGTVENLHAAIWEIGKCLIDDWERGAGTVFYNPVSRITQPLPSLAQGTPPPQPVASDTPPVVNEGVQENFVSYGAPVFPTPQLPFLQQPKVTQNISIPADMVGCIIGRGGSKISEIRRTSGSKISIAKEPHDETGERMFTITGTHEENEKALFLLYQQLELEKDRRSH